MTSPSDTVLQSAAISYVALGWPVLPLLPRDKKPATKHGLHDATTDPDLVEAWWTAHPDYNIGLRTGITFDVLDLDGDAALASINLIAPGYKHAGPVSCTGRGYHLLFAPSGARNGAGMLPGLDFRGDGGYIVAPPSIHPSGHDYFWVRPVSTPLPPTPEWLISLLTYKGPDRENRKPTGPVAQALGMLSTADELAKMGVQVRQVGNRLVARCPLGTHKDTDPSFNIYPDDSFFCFGCMAWGDALNLVRFQRDGTLR